MALGFDCGTMNLIVAKRSKKGIDFQKEINAFIEVPLENPFTFNMLRDNNVGLIENKKDKIAYALSDAALNIAYTWDQLELKRPMSDGCINPREKSAFQILKSMIHTMIANEITVDGETVCYCVPANAVNHDTDAEYHKKVLEGMFKAYEKDGKKINPIVINEALAIIYAELGNKMMTGLGISCGAGMTNVCYANMSIPVFQFSIVNSGDWIDDRSAKATGESKAFINKEKEKISLIAQPENLIQRAIQTQYRIMIEQTVKGIKEAFEKSSGKVKANKPLDIVLAGGTSSPEGFEKVFEEVIRKTSLPIEIGEVRKATDNLYTVAKGCLIAAERSDVS